jgi:protein-tyrosine phosphatase
MQSSALRVQARRYTVIACNACAVFAMSDGARAEITAARAERIDASHLEITWVASEPVELYLTDAARRSSKRLSTANRDERFLATVPVGARPHFLLRDTGDGTTVHLSERVVALENGSNFRDVGGYPAANGRHVRWGLIYRSGATPLLSAHDIATVRSLGLERLVDLRSSEERKLAPSVLTQNGFRVEAIDYPFESIPSTYIGILTQLSSEYRMLFDQLLSSRTPIVYNCTAGQDRTGIATALVLSALGVPRDVILADYHLSTVYRRPQFETPRIDPSRYPGNPAAALLAQVPNSRPEPLYLPSGRSYLADLLDTIDARWGSVNGYLDKVLHVDSAQLETLRRGYLE